ncbi:MAG: hypothetical protein IT196_01375 [Acidimicrobiales bacterium]|nr:hypothetical protein [Acidimicrobiales bacterium]
MKRGFAGLGIGVAVGMMAACGTAQAPGTVTPRVAVTHFTVPTTAVTAGAALDAPSTAADTDPDRFSTEPSRPMGTGPAVRIMPLGDSLTQGDDPADPMSPQSYRGALEARLHAAGYAFDFVGSDRTPARGGTDADNEGHGGFTIGPDESTLCTGCPPANLRAHLDGWLDEARPDVIILLIGVNDLFPMDRTTAAGAYRPVRPEDAPAKLDALVDRIAELAPQAEIMVASYPPVPVFRTAGPETRARFDALNDAARTIGTSGGRLHYIPLAEQLAVDWTLVDTIGDGLHPSPPGSDKIAAVIEQALVPVLDQTP